MEVLVFMALAIVLAGLLWPYIFGRRVESRRNMCDFRLTHLAFAMQMAESDSHYLPNYRTLWQPTASIEADGIQHERVAGWPFWALPTLGLEPPVGTDDKESRSDLRSGKHRELFDSFVSDYSPQAPKKLRDTYLPELVCPDNSPIELGKGDPLPGGYTSFVANGGLPDVPRTNSNAVLVDYPANGLFVDDPQLTGEVYDWETHTLKSISEKDGLDHTLMLSENVDAGNWIDANPSGLLFHWKPTDPFPEGVQVQEVFGVNQRRGEGRGKNDIRFARISSNHPGIANVVYASGRTDQLHESISPRVLQFLMMSSDKDGKWPGTIIPILKTVLAE